MNKKCKILFRTSGGTAKNKELGLGHIYRTTNLASSFKNCNISFLIEDYGTAAAVIESRGFKKISILKKNISLDLDIKQTLKYIQKNKINILIVDKYKLKQKFVRELKKSIKIVVISDLYNYNYPSNLVFNGFIGFKNQIKLNKYNTNCFLGPKYQILDSRYSKKINSKKEYDLLATFGGFDENNISQILINFLIKSSCPLKIKIILGPATKKLKNQIKKPNLDIIKQTKNLQKEISKSKFAICSGGITTYEMANMGINFAILCQNDHQLITAKEWEKANLALNLGKINKNLEKNIEIFLTKLYRKNISLVTKPSIVDGGGANRISKEILKLYKP